MATPNAAPAQPSSSDRIEKRIIIDAPHSRVWRAITDVAQFNQWFGVNLEGAFTPGQEITGYMRVPGYEWLVMHVWVEALEPERYFSFRWHPYAIEPGVDYSNEPTTLVSFTLEDVHGGTQLTIVESGFDAIPASRRAKAFSANEGGWAAQAENIRRFLTGLPST